MHDIDWEARRQAIDRETLRLGQERDTPRGRRKCKLRRFGVRSARIAAGVFWAVIGLVLISNAPEVSDIPFAALTLGKLMKWAACWLIGGWMVWSAFVMAFGAGPTRKEREEALVNDATTNVDLRAASLGGRYQ